MTIYSVEGVDDISFSDSLAAAYSTESADNISLADVSAMICVVNASTYDVLNFSGGATVSLAYGISDTLAFSESILARFTGTAPASDTLTLADGISYVARALAEDGLNLADLAEPDLLRLAAAADLLQLVSTAESSASVLAALVETLVLNDFARYVAEVSVEDTITLAEQVTAAIKAQVEAEDTLTLLETLRSSVVILASDTLELSEGLAPTLKTVLAAKDTLVFIGSIPLEDGDYQAWVMNADTTGVTTYSNFPMDSLWTDPSSGKPYGLTAEGIYELAGADDEGESIDWRLRTGEIDFGVGTWKNVPHAYLYLQTDGTVTLKTISSRGGVKKEHYYNVLPRAADGEDQAYRLVQLWRTVRATWWQFELQSVDGTSVDLAGAEVLPVLLSRRG